MRSALLAFVCSMVFLGTYAQAGFPLGGFEGSGHGGFPGETDNRYRIKIAFTANTFEVAYDWENGLKCRFTVKYRIDEFGKVSYFQLDPIRQVFLRVGQGHCYGQHCSQIGFFMSDDRECGGTGQMHYTFVDDKIYRSYLRDDGHSQEDILERK